MDLYPKKMHVSAWCLVSFGLAEAVPCFVADIIMRVLGVQLRMPGSIFQRQSKKGSIIAAGRQPSLKKTGKSKKMQESAPGKFEAGLISLANKCVSCGLCLPECPTYRTLESETDSPRGRVMLIRGLLEGELAVGPALTTHLERCLACRSCEVVCPSGVEYGALIDGVRQVMANKGFRPGGFFSWVPKILSAPALLGMASRLRFREHYPAKGKQHGSVALFLGCIGRLADAETLRAAIYVLTRLGYEVHVPRAQGCCGAMHQHGGDMERANALAEKNISVFEGVAEKMPVLFSTSGCGANLVEYGRYGNAGRSLANRMTDLVSFLVNAQGWDAVKIAPQQETIAVHEPCSARNVLRNAADSYRLLRKIPQLQIEELAGNGQCCGSAGLYYLKQPKMATKLLADKMAAAQANAASLVSSTNYGCARWIAKGLRSRGNSLRVVHPVVFLANQMGFNGTC